MFNEDDLLDLLDGPFKNLRDTNHVDPYSVLVYDAAQQPVLQALDFVAVVERYPHGVGGYWSAEDLGNLVGEKATAYKQSLVAHEVSDERPEATPLCATVLLAVRGRGLPHRRYVLQAAVCPELN